MRQALIEELKSEKENLEKQLFAVKGLIRLYQDQDDLNTPLGKVKVYVKTNGLNKKTRKRPIVHERWYIAVYIKTKFNLTHEEIGDILDVDHATITHSIKRHESKFKKDTCYMSNVNILCDLFPL